ncbi:MAG: hypothetical protein KDD56_09035, partial [Bdellovibrionales bacterium]|nr:hypothetical protein [Bdellovibrionales bacterium]
QLVSKEKVEILGLNINQHIPDGLSASECIKEILNLGGLAVINWAPGKWLFKRRQIIKRLLKDFDTNLALGDTTLRPKLFPEPSLMSRHIADSKPVIRGSDPLPCPGEERLIGSYCIKHKFENPKDINRLKIELVDFLCKESHSAKALGKRSSLAQVYWRLKRYYS